MGVYLAMDTLHARSGKSQDGEGGGEGKEKEHRVERGGRTNRLISPEKEVEEEATNRIFVATDRQRLSSSICEHSEDCVFAAYRFSPSEQEKDIRRSLPVLSPTLSTPLHLLSRGGSEIETIFHQSADISTTTAHHLFSTLGVGKIFQGLPTTTTFDH